MEIKVFENPDRTDVKDFYVSCGHDRGPDPENKVIVALENGKIIGAVRLCFEHGVYMLRTMDVAAECQGKGIGTLLLKKFEELLCNNECYCLAYAHLENFYGQIGFQTVTNERDAPQFLQDRVADYRTRPNAKKFKVMKKK
jgi:predicted N-acetyltransferase YhbS